MKQWIAAAALAASLGLAAATPAQATATLTVDGAGNLTGATGVTVGSATYDVDFRDGTCFGLYGGCDSTGDFTFHSAADAEAAAQALLDQVLIDDGTHSFDSLPGKTSGCATAETFCDPFIPYGFFDADHVLIAAAINSNAEANDGTISGGDLGTLADTTPNIFFTWAVFTPVSSVPEASTWAMMLLGLGGIGAALRRRKLAALA